MPHLSGEKKLILAALLLVIAEQDPANVKVKHRGRKRDERLKRLIAHEAALFVSSREFDSMAEAAGFNPDELRSQSPAKAMRAYLTLDQVKDTE